MLIIKLFYYLYVALLLAFPISWASNVLLLNYNILPYVSIPYTHIFSFLYLLLLVTEVIKCVLYKNIWDSISIYINKFIQNYKGKK